MDQITLLWWVTGIYLLVLVLVLAYATITVAFYAVRISRTFNKLAAGLTAVRDHTFPLADKLSAANAGLGAIAGSLAPARNHLVATDAGLAILTGDDQEKVA